MINTNQRLITWCRLGLIKNGWRSVILPQLMTSIPSQGKRSSKSRRSETYSLKLTTTARVLLMSLSSIASLSRMEWKYQSLRFKSYLTVEMRSNLILLLKNSRICTKTRKQMIFSEAFHKGQDLSKSKKWTRESKSSAGTGTCISLKTIALTPVVPSLMQLNAVLVITTYPMASSSSIALAKSAN